MSYSVIDGLVLFLPRDALHANDVYATAILSLSVYLSLRLSVILVHYVETAEWIVLVYDMTAAALGTANTAI